MAMPPAVRPCDRYAGLESEHAPLAGPTFLAVGNGLRTYET
jgi:hypothetical protein